MAKTQWHPAFCAAMRLELKGNPALKFTNEFNLTEKPLEVDMLIIKKEADVRIDNPLGEFFGKHNLLEYKSPTDHNFNEFAIYQALAYAYYYCGRYQVNDVTVSLVVSKAHFDLLKWLEKRAVAYDRRHNGVYTLYGFGLMRVQLVVTEEIDKEVFIWLSALTDQLTEGEARRLTGTAGELAENEEKRLAYAVMQVLLSANQNVFEKIKGDGVMTMMELMKPEVEAYAKKYAEECVKDCEIEMAKTMIQHNYDDEAIQLLTHLTSKEIEELRKEI